MPTLALALLFKTRRKNKDNKIRQYFLILYQGLTPQCFYWEFVNILRKTLILASLLLSDSLKIILASAVLITSGRIQMHLKPYKNNENNQVEFIAMTSGVVIILGTLIFTEEKKVDFIQTAVLIFTIIINAIFFIKWIQLL